MPDEVVEALGSSRRPAVKVTVNGYTYRSAVATMGGTPMISLSAEHRTASGLAGDGVEVDLELDTAPPRGRDPARLAAALDAEPAAAAPSTPSPTATDPGMSSRSRGPRPTRPASAASPSRSRP